MNYIEILSIIKSVLENKISQRGFKLNVSICQDESKGCIKDGLKVFSNEYNFEIFARIVEDNFENNPIPATCIGMHADEIAESILSAYGEGLQDAGIIEERIQHFENVEDAVLPVLYSKETFDFMEEDCPHRAFLDLGICYRIFGDKMGVPIGTMLIKNKVIEEWGITEEVLHQKAMENMLNCTTIKNMWDVLPISETDRKQHFEMDEGDNQHDLYLVKYDMAFLGAGAMLDSGRLKELANQINTKKLIIIPSSVHECLVADGNHVNIDYLRELIRFENKTAVKEEDVLSYGVYYYNVEEGYGMYSATE